MYELAPSASTASLLVVLNRQGRIVHFNKACECLTGYTFEELSNRPIWDLLSPPEAEKAKTFFLSGLDGEIPSTYALSWLDRNRHPRPIEWSNTLLPDSEGALNYILCVGVCATAEDPSAAAHPIAQEQANPVAPFLGIVGRDPKMLDIFSSIRKLAHTDASVLIQGESGTGKELVAGAIHRSGPRAGRLFVPVNCAALPESLLESELFGHVRGAFSGAVRDKKGRFELADGGTIFLDEVADMSPAVQVSLLRVLQDGAFERVGGEQTVRVNVRVISATNKDLADEMAKGRFREDLFYRLAVVPIHLPPLRERRGDIPFLVRHILDCQASNEGMPPVEIMPEALGALVHYGWPGNIRELQNAIHYALVQSQGNPLGLEHLPETIFRKPPVPIPAAQRGRRPKLKPAAVKEILQETGGNRMETARRLHVSRTTLYRFLHRACL